MSLIEQAAKRLEQLRKAGVAVHGPTSDDDQAPRYGGAETRVPSAAASLEAGPSAPVVSAAAATRGAAPVAAEIGRAHV